MATSSSRSLAAEACSPAFTCTSLHVWAAGKGSGTGLVDKLVLAQGRRDKVSEAACRKSSTLRIADGLARHT